MSMNIEGKTAEQCRTHHQQALKKYKKVDKIISLLLPNMRQKLSQLKKKELVVL